MCPSKSILPLLQRLRAGGEWAGYALLALVLLVAMPQIGRAHV